MHGKILRINHILYTTTSFNGKRNLQYKLIVYSKNLLYEKYTYHVTEFLAAVNTTKAVPRINVAFLTESISGLDCTVTVLSGEDGGVCIFLEV